MIAKLLHWWRLLIEPGGKNLATFLNMPQRWRVIYPSGEKSFPMAYDVACVYRDLFGGRIVRYRKKR